MAVRNFSVSGLSLTTKLTLFGIAALPHFGYLANWVNCVARFNLSIEGYLNSLACIFLDLILIEGNCQFWPFFVNVKHLPATINRYSRISIKCQDFFQGIRKYKLICYSWNFFNPLYLKVLVKLPSLRSLTIYFLRNWWRSRLINCLFSFP